jgi:hypothetical protein
MQVELTYSAIHPLLRAVDLSDLGQTRETDLGDTFSSCRRGPHLDH